MGRQLVIDGLVLPLLQSLWCSAALRQVVPFMPSFRCSLNSHARVEAPTGSGGSADNLCRSAVGCGRRSIRLPSRRLCHSIEEGGYDRGGTLLRRCGFQLEAPCCHESHIRIWRNLSSCLPTGECIRSRHTYKSQASALTAVSIVLKKSASLAGRGLSLRDDGSLNTPILSRAFIRTSGHIVKSLAAHNAGAFPRRVVVSPPLGGRQKESLIKTTLSTFLDNRLTQ